MYDRGGGVMFYLGDTGTDYVVVLVVAILLYSGFMVFLCKCVLPRVFTRIRRESENEK